MFFRRTTRLEPSGPLSQCTHAFVLCDLCNDCTCENVACGRCIWLHSGSSDGSGSARHNPTEVQFSQSPQHPCRRFFRFEVSSSFSAFYLVVLQPCSAGEQTLVPFASRFIFIELTFGRMPILTR